MVQKSGFVRPPSKPNRSYAATTVAEIYTDTVKISNRSIAERPFLKPRSLCSESRNKQMTTIFKVTQEHNILRSHRIQWFSLNCPSVLKTFWDLFSRVLWEKGDYKMLMNLRQGGSKELEQHHESE